MQKPGNAPNMRGSCGSAAEARSGRCSAPLRASSRRCCSSGSPAAALHAKRWPAQLLRATTRQRAPCVVTHAQQQQAQQQHSFFWYPGQRPAYAAASQQQRQSVKAVVYLPNFLHPDDAETIQREYRQLR